MGESKRRGSKEDRIAQAIGLRKHKLDEIKKRLDLPENADFCGYLIHLVEKDEFVHSIENTSQVIKRTFVKAPELAMRFERFWDAHKYTKEKGEAVVGLFEMDGQSIIRSVL